MLRRIAFILTAILLLTDPVFSEKELPLTSKSVVLMDPLTKRILYSKDAHKRLSPASTAKIMTAFLVLKKSQPNKKVMVSEYASSIEPSKVHIKEGEIYFTEDLLKALLLNSGNDASVALAENIAGSEPAFAEMMNKKAKGIGAHNTNFRNASGLPSEDQYSSAYDLSLVVREAMKHKRFVDIIETKRAEIYEINSGRKIKLKSHNKALWHDNPYIIFGKTGYTKKARHCFAGYVQYNRWRKVIVVILGSNSLWNDLKSLADSLT